MGLKVQVCNYHLNSFMHFINQVLSLPWFSSPLVMPKLFIVLKNMFEIFFFWFLKKNSEMYTLKLYFSKVDASHPQPIFSKNCTSGMVRLAPSPVAHWVVWPAADIHSLLFHPFSRNEWGEWSEGKVKVKQRHGQL